MNRLLFLFLFSTFIACEPTGSSDSLEFNLQNQEIQSILNSQDERDSWGLLPFLSSEKASERYLAATALASVQDSSMIDTLAGLLDDPNVKVRRAVAYALGQSGHPTAENHILKAFGKETNHSVMKVLLEAVGKTGSKKQLENLATISTYNPSDTLLLEGQAWGIFRYALRGITDPKATNLMAKYAGGDEYPEAVRFAAANYLARAKDIDIKAFSNQLTSQFRKEGDYRIRAALASAIGKSQDTTALKALISSVENESDYRVKCNSIRSLSNYDYLLVNQIVSNALFDENIHVAKTAADWFKSNGNSKDAFNYRVLADSLNYWETKATMFGAALKHMSPSFYLTKNQISRYMIDGFSKSENEYERAKIISELGSNVWNYGFLQEQLLSDSSSLLVKSYAADGLATIRKDPKFNIKFGERYRQIRYEMHNVFKEAILQGDVAVIATLAEIFKDPKMKMKLYMPDYSFLIEARKKLILPRDIEAFQILQEAINYMSDAKEQIPEMQAKNRIDWMNLTALGNDATAVIKTAKGNIRIQFFPVEAPGSVVNFVRLAKEGFYDKKTIHRVVPNFVIQGGCPRGDGWGSLDYTIRSEFAPLNYHEEGYVGMASAGKDTECTQWFITHSPTPHLDGRYTIFAKVVEGMDIVHDIQVGDQIKTVEIITKKRK